MGSCLSHGLDAGLGCGHYLVSINSRFDPPSSFVWSFVKDKLHILSIAITMKNLKEQIRIVTAKH
jgi:hypothetical protein